MLFIKCTEYGFSQVLALKNNCTTIRLDQNVWFFLRIGWWFFSNSFSKTVCRLVSSVYLSFNVAMLNSTQSTVMIQNLVTIFVSCNPFFWK